MRFFFAMTFVVLAGGVIAFLLTHGPDSDGLPETVPQQIVDSDGGSQTWQVTKRQVPSYKRAERVLPEAATRAESDEEGDQKALLLNERAMQAAQTGDIRGAIDLFEGAVSGKPGVAAPYSNYGRLLTRMTAYEEALPLLERAAQLTPEDPQVWLDLQTLYERAVQLERAFYARKKAEALAPGWRIVRDAHGFYRLEGT